MIIVVGLVILTAAVAHADMEAQRSPGDLGAIWPMRGFELLAG
jgi:hypothetical protein